MHGILSLQSPCYGCDCKRISLLDRWPTQCPQTCTGKLLLSWPTGRPGTARTFSQYLHDFLPHGDLNLPRQFTRSFRREECPAARLAPVPLRALNYRRRLVVPRLKLPANLLHPLRIAGRASHFHIFVQTMLIYCRIPVAKAYQQL